jgi:hypothetical protein
VRLYYESPEGGISVGEMIDGDDASLMCEYHESKEWINHNNHGIDEIMTQENIVIHRTIHDNNIDQNHLTT